MAQQLVVEIVNYQELNKSTIRVNKLFSKLIERIISDWLIRRYLPWLGTPVMLVIVFTIAILIGFISLIF